MGYVRILVKRLTGFETGRNLSFVPLLKLVFHSFSQFFIFIALSLPGNISLFLGILNC